MIELFLKIKLHLHLSIVKYHPFSVNSSMSTAINDTLSILQQAATEARGLAIDSIDACSSGHLGLPLGCAEIELHYSAPR